MPTPKKTTKKVLADRQAKKKAEFLAKLTQMGGTILQAAAAANVDKSTLYRWRQEDEDFEAGWEAALESSTEKLEQAAYKRALSNSDTLMIFLLKSRKPEVYNDKVRLEHTGADGEPIKIESDNLEELEAEAAALRAQVESLESDR